jgi:hypothetical protein
MKHHNILIFTLLILGTIYSNLFSQNRKELLESSKNIKYKEYLQFRLDLLATQISNGSSYFMDIGSYKITNTIEVTESGMISVEIYFDRIDIKKIPEINIRKEILEEQLTYFKVCIEIMMRKYFPQYNYNIKYDLIIKSYYKSEGLHPEVFHYKNDEIIWYNP